MTQDEPFLLKNLFDRTSVGAIGDAVGAALPAFDRPLFMERVFDDGWEARELKQRMRHVTTVLHDLIPGDYRRQLDVLLAAAQSATEGFAALVYSDFVQTYGTGDWEASVPALATFTRLASAEFAIRPFIASDQERTLARMLEWAADPDPAVRRLATEGCRPRLPWGMRLHALVADPSPILPILERLHTDPDESVRRSVANNLNDISRDHPQVVIDLLHSWDPQPGTDTYRLARHALRTLLKRGDPGALAVLGFKAGLSVELNDLTLEPANPRIGGNARLTFTITSTLRRNPAGDGRLRRPLRKSRRLDVAQGLPPRLFGDGARNPGDLQPQAQLPADDHPDAPAGHPPDRRAGQRRSRRLSRVRAQLTSRR